MNTGNKFYFPQLFYHTSPVYPDNNTSCDVSTTKCLKNVYIKSFNPVLKLVMIFQVEICSWE